MTTYLITSQRDADGREEPGLHPVANAVGLFLKVARGGSQSWLYRFTLRGHARDMGLGPAEDVKLAEAIDLAAKARTLRAKGIDPIEARKTAREQERETERKAANARTFKECAREYLAENSPGWKNQKHRQQWFNSLENYVYPLIGDVPVENVDVTAVLEVLRPLKDRPETCARVRGRIETIIDFATPQYRTGDNPATWRILKHKIKLAREVKNHAAMKHEELPAFMADLRRRTSVSAAALEFLILTAARTTEVIEAPWSEIDLGKRLWTVSAARMKGRQEHRVPLSDAAVAVLKRMQADRRGDLVFGLSNNALLKMLTLMGRADITSHGFRATFKTWAGEETSFQREVIEKALSHVVGDETERAYERGDWLEKRRKLMDAWAAYIGGAGNVVALRSA